MKKILFSLLTLCLVQIAVAQTDKNVGVATSVEYGRWEIIQSPVKTSLLYKLDKYTGEVYQLDHNLFSSPSWVRMEKSQEDDENARLSDGINYQLYLGGLDSSDCFLINIHTGKTWRLDSGFFSRDSWKLIEE